MPEKKLNLLLSIPIINNIVRKKIKHALGLSRATCIYSAAAPISLDLLRWFDKLGITIRQALGMTEDCVYAHFERPNARRMGSVGIGWDADKNYRRRRIKSENAFQHHWVL
jgi:long-chain acyl-CoA synthetase